MKPFAYHTPADPGQLQELLGANNGPARIIAGGSDLLGELKSGLVHYPHLVSLAGLGGLDAVRQEGAGLHLGAMVTLAGLERARLLAGPYAMLAEAARGVATPEIRNQGTLGGNLCQRPRCLHYRSSWVPCLKKGGEGCPAREGEQQGYLSVMGGGACAAVNPSDLAPPLLALGAEAVLKKGDAERQVPLDAFFAGPEEIARRDNVLAEGEWLAGVRLPPAPEGWRGVYLKARERTAGDFALAGVAFGCRLEGETMRDVRLVTGSLAAAPARMPGAEALLEGQSLTGELAGRAADAVFAQAQPLAHNGFKLALGRALVTRAITQVVATLG